MMRPRFANFLALGEAGLPESSLTGDTPGRTALIGKALSSVCPADIAGVAGIIVWLCEEPLFAADAPDRPDQLRQWRRACVSASAPKS